MSGDIYEDEVPGWALKSKSTKHPDHGHHGDLPLPGKIPMVEPGIEPGTSWLVVRNPDHHTPRLVGRRNIRCGNFCLYRLEKEEIFCLWPLLKD